MNLLIVRHAIAMEREDWAKLSSDDHLRPITDKGANRMKKGAKGLVNVLGDELPELVISSPLVRAKQTAEIFLSELSAARKVNELPAPQIVQTETLAPDEDVAEFVRYLAENLESSSVRKSKKVIACIGHEPHLNHLIAWLVSKSRNGVGELKKGGACLLEFDDSVDAGCARLVWLMTASQLRNFS